MYICIHYYNRYYMNIFLGTPLVPLEGVGAALRRAHGHARGHRLLRAPVLRGFRGY